MKRFDLKIAVSVGFRDMSGPDINKSNSDKSATRAIDTTGDSIPAGSCGTSVSPRHYPHARTS